MSEVNSIFTLANFNQQNFNTALKKEIKGCVVESVEYEQMFPYLLGLSAVVEKKPVCICWLSMRDVMQATAMKMDLVELVLKLKEAFHHTIIILPTVDSPAFNMFQGFETRNQLFQFRLKMAELTEGANMAVLDPTPWMIKHGSNAVSSQLW